MIIKGVPLYECHLPRNSRMAPRVPRRPSTATAPRATRTLGWIILICSIRYGRQVCISTGVGARLPDEPCGMLGRHFKMLAMYTSPRANPIVSIILVSNWPARPTNGSPCASSSAPGASPINITSASGLPTPNTVCVLELARCGHFMAKAAGSRVRTVALALRFSVRLMWEKLSSNQQPKKPVPPVMKMRLFRISSQSGLVSLRIWSRSEVGKGCCAIGSIRYSRRCLDSMA